MAEAAGDRAGRLRAEYHSQTARIRWHELQGAFARGDAIGVAAGLDLVEVAVQLGLDNAAQFEQWLSAGSVAPVSDDQALAWYEANREVWAVVAPPWVLVQPTGA